MKINEILNTPLQAEWNDADLVICLESAYSNLLRLRVNHPEKKDLIPKNPKTGEEMLGKAKDLHALNKDKSMMVVAVESYAGDSDSELAQLLLEAMSNDKQ